MINKHFKKSGLSKLYVSRCAFPHFKASFWQIWHFSLMFPLKDWCSTVVEHFCLYPKVKCSSPTRLCHPPDGSTSPKHKLLCFITAKKFCKEKNALAFNWDRCCHLVLCLRLIPFHYDNKEWYRENDKKALEDILWKPFPDLEKKNLLVVYFNFVLLPFSLSNYLKFSNCSFTLFVNLASLQRGNLTKCQVN